MFPILTPAADSRNVTSAVNAESDGKYSEYYKAFYYLNRGVLRAEMIDFISSIENNVQTLTMDDKGTTRARVRDQVSRTYDYSEAIDDMLAADRHSDIPTLLSSEAHMGYDKLYLLEE